MAGGHAPRTPISRRRGHKAGTKDNKSPQGCRGCNESPTPTKKKGWGANPAIPHDLPRVLDGKRQREVGCHIEDNFTQLRHGATPERRCPGGYHQKTKWHLQHLTAWGRGTLHHEYEPLKEEGSRKGHTHRSSWKGGQSSLHPGRLPPAYRAGAEPRRGHLIWHCCGRESKKSHGRAAGTRLGPLTNKQTPPWAGTRHPQAIASTAGSLRIGTGEVSLVVPRPRHPPPLCTCRAALTRQPAAPARKPAAPVRKPVALPRQLAALPGSCREASVNFQRLP
jgi:hypothetical protein